MRAYAALEIKFLKIFFSLLISLFIIKSQLNQQMVYISKIKIRT